jgi:ribosomal protein S18 acetylase RimI-like enzyme
MGEIVIRNFKPEDVAQISRLDKKYCNAFPDSSPVQAELYLSPEFEDGKDVFCAFDEQGTLVGYAPVYAALAEEGSGYPNTLWVEIKVDPEFQDKKPLRDLLFDKMMARSLEIGNNAPVKNTKISCCHFTTETESIDYVLSKGFELCEGIYNMTRELSEPIIEAAVPEGLEIVEWRMETREERAKYIDAYNIAFPERPWNVEGLEHFMKSDMWVGGTAITAFDGNDIAGSIMLYWKTDAEAEYGKKQAFSENIFVMPQWRRKGAASCLISKGLSYLARHGAKTVLLQVRANNIKALDIYKRMGYRIVKEQRVLEYPLKDER